MIEIIDSINFNSANPQESINLAKRTGVRYFSLLSSYTHPNLELLLPLKESIEGISLNETVGIGLLKEFQNIKHLAGLDFVKEPLDLKWFKELESIAFTPSKFIVDLDACRKLKKLTLSSFNPKSHNLADLPTLGSLETFALVKSNIWSLEGISKFKTLKELNIYGASQFKSCVALGDLHKTLKVISFESCRKLCDLEMLGKVKSLEKLLLTNCGSIPNLAFIHELKGLKRFSFVGTNILDGDLTYCNGLVYVGFDEKKHYNRKIKDFNAHG